MKKTLLALSFIVISTESFANSMFICRNEGKPEMNLVFITQNQNVYSYKTLTSVWRTDIEGLEISSTEKQYNFLYDDSNDMKRAYDIVINNREEIVSARELVDGIESDTFVYCDLFKI